VKSLVRERDAALYRLLGVQTPQAPNAVDYSTLVNLENTSQKLNGDAFADWLRKNKIPTELLFRVADETGVVLLLGSVFGV